MTREMPKTSGIEFDKYDRKGAYHWRDYHGGLLRMNAYTRARYDKIVDCLARLETANGARLLDYGCGDGALAGVLHGCFARPVFGVDVNPLAITLAEGEFGRRGYDGRFKVIEGYDTGFPDGHFDAAVCSDVIEHVTEPLALLREIYRVLRPGGHLVITTPIRFSEDPVDPMHVREWFTGEFVALCREVFGEPLSVERTHPVFWYEFLNINNKWLNRFARVGINLATRLGFNPFKQTSGLWRCYTTQTVVLRKGPDR